MVTQAFALKETDVSLSQRPAWSTYTVSSSTSRLHYRETLSLPTPINKNKILIFMHNKTNFYDTVLD